MRLIDIHFDTDYFKRLPHTTEFSCTSQSMHVIYNMATSISKFRL